MWKINHPHRLPPFDSNQLYTTINNIYIYIYIHRISRYIYIYILYSIFIIGDDGCCSGLKVIIVIIHSFHHHHHHIYIYIYISYSTSG